MACRGQRRPGRHRSCVGIRRFRTIVTVYQLRNGAADGFISVERFHSVSNEAKYVSVSFWRDEQAVKARREHAEHRLAQAQGKREIFADFRIRVAEVVRDYTLADSRT